MNLKNKIMNLQLSLTSNWFDKTFRSIKPKTEDYREVNPYWCQRLILLKGKQMSLKWWKEVFSYKLITNDLKQFLEFKYLNSYTFKPFTQNTITKGYPKKTDTSRIATFEHLGIKIDYGKEEWGAEPNKLYFVIKHGKRL